MLEGSSHHIMINKHWFERSGRKTHHYSDFISEIASLSMNLKLRKNLLTLQV